MKKLPKRLPGLKGRARTRFRKPFNGVVTWGVAERPRRWSILYRKCWKEPQWTVEVHHADVNSNGCVPSSTCGHASTIADCEKEIFRVLEIDLLREQSITPPKKRKRRGAPVDMDTPSTTVLLTEIRDLLRALLKAVNEQAAGGNP